jgi:hypothetical protein
MTYFASIGLDASEFVGGLSKSSQGMLAFARDVTVTMNMTMMIFDRVISSVDKFGQMANSLRDLSYTTGVTTDQLQRLHYAAMLSGTSVYTVDTSLQKLSLSMNEAADASSAAGKAFAQLGVDPTGKTVDQVFEDTAAALTGMKSETDRNSIAMDIYGRAWKELIPTIQTYIDKKDEIKKAPIMSQEELNNLAEAKVGWDKLINSVTIYSGKVLAFSEKQWGNKEKTNQNMYNNLHQSLYGSPSGAGGREGSGTLPAVAQDLTPLIDKYTGLTDAQIELLQTQGELTAAQDVYNKALVSGSQEKLDKAAANVQILKNHLVDLEVIAGSTEKDRITNLISLYKHYENEIKNVAKDKKDLYNLDHDYAEDIMSAGRDISSQRSITTNFIRQRRSITGNLDTDVSEVVSAATSYNAIKGGAALETVKGPPQYTEAQAKKGLSGITITGDIYLNGDKSFENYLSSQLLRNGVSP